VVPDDATRAAFQRPHHATAPGPARRARRAGGARNAARTPPGSQLAPGRPGQPGAPLIGRLAELGALRETWRAAVAGWRGVVLVEGSAGVGKTRLVAEVAELARQQGAIVVAALCFAAPGRMALAPVADWLRDPAVQAARRPSTPPGRPRSRGWCRT